MNDTLTKLRIANVERGKLWNSGWNPDSNFTTESYIIELLFRSNELGGEVGEAQNKVKKYVRYLRQMAGGISKEESIKEIEKELADVIICVDRVADIFGIDLNKAVVDKFNETSDKRGFNIKL